jgi:uncharacterized protein with HEPN domain
MNKAGRTVPDLLEHILQWADRIDRLTEGLSQEKFLGSELHQLAVSKCIEAIGEASGLLRKLHPEFVSAHPDLAFEEAYRTRNRLSHGYDTIDWLIVWRTATEYVPLLAAHCRKLLEADL